MKRAQPRLGGEIGDRHGLGQVMLDALAYASQSAGGESPRGLLVNIRAGAAQDRDHERLDQAIRQQRPMLGRRFDLPRQGREDRRQERVVDTEAKGNGVR
jgi:hypothetical protein